MKKVFVALFLLLPVVTSAVTPQDRTLKKCAELIQQGLSLSEVFALLSSRKLFKDGHLPKAQAATFRLVRMEGTEAAVPRAELERTFTEVLAEYDMTLEEWKSIEGIELDKGVLGSPEVMAQLKGKKPALTPEQIAAFGKLNDAAEAARERLKGLLIASEQLSFAESQQLLSEEALLELLHRFSRDPKLGLNYLGVNDLQAWRYSVITEQETFRTKIEKALIHAVLDAVQGPQEIPETSEKLLVLVAEKMNLPVETVQSYIGENGVFKDGNALIAATKAKHPTAFTKVLDRRFFSEERRAKMLEAIKNANEVVLFKMAENQDLLDFEAIRRLAQELNAPIVVAPAFAEIGLIPERLDWLFNEPNVHFMVDRGIQLTRDFFVVDHGYEDKRQNPFTGMHEIYQPTDRVLSFHVKVRTETRATANYDVRPGYFMSTGSMSDPAYWGEFRISMSTDERAQLEAEQNRGVVVLSRRYRNDKLSRLVGSANGIAPRRARFTESRYGYPAGLFDLGKIYGNDGVTEVKSIPALVLGDIHLGNTDPAFLKGTLGTLESLKIVEKNPAYGKPFEMEYREGETSLGAVVLHDLVDGGPNNGHMMDDLLTLAIQDARGGLDLLNHFQSAAGFLKQLTQLLPDTKVVVPVDNHGFDWLVKRLKDADLLKTGRPKEIPLILKLMIDAIEEKANPYERIFQYFGINTDQVLFMNKEDTFRVGIDLERPTNFRMTHGVEVGQHSHMGINGSKSISLGKLLVAYGANVTGHTHSTAEKGQAVKVGTGTPPRQDYHRGPSNSDASIAVVYSEQAVQLLRLERGSFVPNAERQRPEEFYPGEFPRILIRELPPDGKRTTDQFRRDPPVNRGSRI